MNKSFALIVLTCIAALGAWFFLFRRGTEQMPATIFTEDAPKPIGPYSQAVLRGNALFVSGQIALDPKTGNADTADIVAETNRVMKNITAILNAAKMKTDDIVKTTIYVTDLKNFATVNETYEKYFTQGRFPARETVQVAALPKKMHVEISVTAIR